MVSISSTERALVQWALEDSGVGKVTGKKTSSPKHSPGITYSVSNRQALDLLHRLSPYLRSYKRQRAELAMEHYRALTPRNGKYSPEMTAAREQFERDFLGIMAGTGRTARGRDAAVLVAERDFAPRRRQRRY